MPQFLINSDVAASEKDFFLSPEESRHVKVLRYRKKDAIKLFDPKGNRYEAEIKDFSEGLVSVGSLKKLVNPPKKTSIKLYLPFVEKSAFEFMLRHCTEAGADVFIPYSAKYSQKNFVFDAEEKKERLEEIILSSVKQCERPDIPALAPPVEFGKGLSLASNPVLLHRDGDSGEKSARPPEITRVTGGIISVFVGPEAGFSSGEIALAREKKVIFMDLGPYIMRTQTAAVAACAVIRALK